ncbi:MAG: SHOCT domain-containing protein [Nitrososphaerota archaeon]|nr:SHOCT domain-containing protein [Nitrososphaerota archaeon]
MGYNDRGRYIIRISMAVLMVLIGVAIVIAVLRGGPGVYTSGSYTYPMMFAFGAWGWVWMVISGLIALSILLIIIGLFIRWVRYGFGYSGREYRILRQRYARGEITKEQYDQMLKDLQAGRA